MRILAVIPARAGSKRLPGKNLLSLADKPLIAHTIERAKACGNLTRVIVSTDSNEIAQASRIFGAEVPWVRPAELATDEAASFDVIKHALDECEKEDGKDYDALVLLQPTSPLRSVEDIDGAIDLFKTSKASMVVSVCEVDHPVEWTVNVDPKDFSLKQVSLTSETGQKELRYNGAVYVYSRDFLMQGKPGIPDDAKAYIMPRARSVDIDDELDFKLAEALL